MSSVILYIVRGTVWFLRNFLLKVSKAETCKNIVPRENCNARVTFQQWWLKQFPQMNKY